MDHRAIGSGTPAAARARGLMPLWIAADTGKDK